MAARFGFKRLFQASVIVFSVFYLLVPFSVLITGGIHPSNVTSRVPSTGLPVGQTATNWTPTNRSHNATGVDQSSWPPTVLTSSLTTSGKTWTTLTHFTASSASAGDEFSCTVYGYSISKGSGNDSEDSSQKECHFLVDGKVQTTAPYSAITPQIWAVVIIFVGGTFLCR